MPTPAEVRRTIEHALASHRPKPLGKVSVITAMRKAGFPSYDRTYLVDFMKGAKSSLHEDFRDDFCQFMGLDPETLRIPKNRPVEVIHKGAKPHYYVAEHMEARGLDEQAMAARMDGMTVEAVRAWLGLPTLSDWHAMGFAHALGLDSPEELTRPPVQAEKPKPAAKRKRA